MSERAGPVFLGGLAHSGKTQVRMVLDAHPELSMTRRTYLWDRFYGRFGDLADHRNLDRCLRAVTADRATSQLDPDPDRIRLDLAGHAPTYARLFGTLHAQHAARLGKPRWGEQLGGVERFADPIFAEFPAARMIHMIRDPRTEIAVGDGLMGTVGWYTARWIASAELAKRNLRRYGGRYRIVRYESLRTAPQDTMRALCDFLDLDLLPDIERAIASIWSESDAPTSSSSPVAARRGSRSATAFVERYAAADLRELAYPDTPGLPRSARDRLSYQLVDRPLNRAAMTAWRLLEGRTLAKPMRDSI